MSRTSPLVVISYANTTQDHALLDEVLLSFNAYGPDDLEVWTDRKANGRTPPLDQILAKFKEANAIILLVTPSYLDRNRVIIRDREIGLALSRTKDAADPVSVYTLYMVSVAPNHADPVWSFRIYPNDRKAICASGVPSQAQMQAILATFAKMVHDEAWNDFNQGRPSTP